LRRANRRVDYGLHPLCSRKGLFTHRSHASSEDEVGGAATKQRSGSRTLLSQIANGMVCPGETIGRQGAPRSCFLRKPRSTPIEPSAREVAAKGYERFCLAIENQPDCAPHLTCEVRFALRQERSDSFAMVFGFERRPKAGLKPTLQKVPFQSDLVPHFVI